ASPADLYVTFLLKSDTVIVSGLSSLELTLLTLAEKFGPATLSTPPSVVPVPRPPTVMVLAPRLLSTYAFMMVCGSVQSQAENDGTTRPPSPSTILPFATPNARRSSVSMTAEISPVVVSDAVVESAANGHGSTPTRGVTGEK